MSKLLPKLDHVHVHVADRQEAARWYNRVFGMAVVEEFAFWADDPQGPLVISNDGGKTELALFQRANAPAPAHRPTIAFRLDGTDFIGFIEQLAQLELYDRAGQRLTPQDVVDHEKSFSLYFTDPDGNPYELTTYDYRQVHGYLARR